MCRANEPVHKPDSVPFKPQPKPRHQRAVNIHLGQSLLTASSSYLQTRRAAFNACTDTPFQMHPHALLPVGFTWPDQSPGLPVRSYRTLSPLPSTTRIDGGLLSVALSRGSLRVAVNNHHALWSPDFPRPMLRYRRGHLVHWTRSP